MDVSRDPRLLMAGKALDMLTDSITSWRMPWRIDRNRLAGELKKSRKALYTMRYSYTPPTTLAKTEEATIIEETARSIAGEILETPPGATLTPAQKLAHATNRWALNILGGLKYRLLLGDEPHPEYSVDIVGVEVTRVEELAPGLKATRATTGRITLTIVTNIQEIKPGEERAEAILMAASTATIIVNNQLTQQVFLNIIATHLRINEVYDALVLKTPLFRYLYSERP